MGIHSTQCLVRSKYSVNVSGQCYRAIISYLNAASAIGVLREAKDIFWAGVIREGYREKRVQLSSKEWMPFRYVDEESEERAVNLASAKMPEEK